ncbi:MAG: redoxin domain-containing protein [Candidatus Eisenbacteria bacterium]|nr:redoxin domain-containing protein [Candidatus Eisenbacteria bacterium]
MRNRKRSGPAATRMGIASALLVLAMAVWTGLAAAQVLGSCGTAAENEPAAAPGTPAVAPQGAPPAPPAPVSRILIPGDRAINFELPAVIGDDIRMVKLSDYNGKWRVVCFYPADFTFV